MNRKQIQQNVDIIAIRVATRPSLSGSRAGYLGVVAAGTKVQSTVSRHNLEPSMLDEVGRIAI
jgi:hypothetical protein